MDGEQIKFLIGIFVMVLIGLWQAYEKRQDKAAGEDESRRRPQMPEPPAAAPQARVSAYPGPHAQGHPMQAPPRRVTPTPAAPAAPLPLAPLPEEGQRVTSGGADLPAGDAYSATDADKAAEAHRRRWRQAIIASEILTPRG